MADTNDIRSSLESATGQAGEAAQAPVVLRLRRQMRKPGLSDSLCRRGLS